MTAVVDSEGSRSRSVRALWCAVTDRGVRAARRPPLSGAV
jgi:hypothetical protein